jgi:hypothetical protein
MAARKKIAIENKTATVADLLTDQDVAEFRKTGGEEAEIVLHSRGKRLAEMDPARLFELGGYMDEQAEEGVGKPAKAELTREEMASKKPHELLANGFGDDFEIDPATTNTGNGLF